MAQLTEQHDMDDGHVFVWRVDGRQVRQSNIWRRVDLELDVAPGSHAVECSYSSADMESTRNARLAFTAEAGRHYVCTPRE